MKRVDCKAYRSKMVTNKLSILFNILFSRVITEYIPGSTLPSFFFFSISKKTVIENTKALFGTTKYNLLETRLNTFVNCFGTISNLSMPIIGLFAKLSKLVPYSLYPKVTVL